jgi:hypothetical protein
MSDSPYSTAPLDPREKPILDVLLVTRDKLLLLKEDKSTHVKSADVLPLYEQVIEQVHKLNDVRADKHLELNRGGSYRSHTIWYRSLLKGHANIYQWTPCLMTPSSLSRSFSLPLGGTMKHLLCRSFYANLGVPLTGHKILHDCHHHCERIPFALVWLPLTFYSGS